MRSVGQYAFINSKVRAMISNLLSVQEMGGLIESRDVEDACIKLAGTAYRDIFKGLGPTYDLHSIERDLIDSDVKLHFKILKGMKKGAARDVVFLLLNKYEVENLKNILRLWNSRADREEAEYIIRDKICYDIPIEKLLDAGNIDEFILLLMNTPYGKPLMTAKDDFSQRGSLFYLEVALDIDYYRRLWEGIATLSQMDRKVASKLIGVEVDIENISWFVRFKKYYTLPLGKLMNYVIPHGFQITEDLVRRVCLTEEMSKLISGMAVKPYQEIKQIAEKSFDKSKMFLMEAILWNVLVSQAKTALAGFPFTIGTITAYLVLKRAETNNIISVLYSKLYDLPPDRVRGSIVM